MHPGAAQFGEMITREFLQPVRVDDGVGEAADVALEGNRSPDHSAQTALQQPDKSRSVTRTDEQQNLEKRRVKSRTASQIIFTTAHLSCRRGICEQNAAERRK